MPRGVSVPTATLVDEVIRDSAPSGRAAHRHTALATGRRHARRGGLLGANPGVTVAPGWRRAGLDERTGGSRRRGSRGANRGPQMARSPTRARGRWGAACLETSGSRARGGLAQAALNRNERYGLRHHEGRRSGVPLRADSPGCCIRRNRPGEVSRGASGRFGTIGVPKAKRTAQNAARRSRDAALDGWPLL